MHEKAFVTDGDSGDELLIGSMNLSPTSLTRNRELAFALDPTTGGPIIAAVERTFDKDFASTSA